MSENALMPIGWFDLVTDLRLALHLEYPTVTVTAMTSDRGWLHIDIDDRQLGPDARYKLGRLIQGFVTQSLTTCMCCGSAYGRDRGEKRIVTCDSCEEETCDA